MALQDALAQAAGKTVTIKLEAYNVQGRPIAFYAPPADAQGGFDSMFNVGNNSNVTLIGEGELNANRTTNVVGVHSGSTLTVNGDIVIDNGKAKERDVGGGIYNAGTVDLKSGAEVQNNQAEQGGGVYNGKEGAAETGTLTIEEGAFISLNKVDRNGDGNGIYNYKGGTVNIEGGEIVSNHSSFNGRGGGIYNNGTVNLNGGEITANSSGSGGGIYNESGATLWVNNSQITKGEVKAVHDNTANGDPNTNNIRWPNV